MKFKKLFLFSLIPTIGVVSFVSSCNVAGNKNEENNDWVFLNNGSNKLKLKKIKEHNNVNVNEINSEQKLLEFYKLINTENNIKYNLKSIVPSNSILKVTYQLIFKKLEVSKTFELTGFVVDSSPIEPNPPINPPTPPIDLTPPVDNEEQLFEKLENEVKRFVVTKKPNKDFSQIYASNINSVDKFREYFDWEEKEGFRYQFIFKYDNLKGELKVEVDILVLDSQNNDFSLDTKILPTITGFMKKTYVQDYNEKVLEQAIKIIKITPKKDISQININDYLSDISSNFTKYFQINKLEIENMDSSIFVYPSPVKTEINPNNFNSLFFTLRIKVGDGKDFVEGEKKVEVSGFKQLLSPLDSNPIINLPTPSNAISYKGKIKPLPKLESISEQNHKIQTNKVSWETYKEEMIYQVRFWLYQIFYDNFSEINYYIIGGHNTGEQFTAIAEGIIKQDMPNLFVAIQKYGNSISTSRTFKKGEKIKLTLKQWIKTMDDPRFSWRPAGGWGDADGFSFVKGISNINYQNSTKVWITQMATDRVFPVEFSVNGQKILYIDSWVMRTYMFTIGRKK